MQLSTTIKITVTSSASEADVCDHLRELVNDIESCQYREWWKKINTSWDESYPVEIKIEEVKDV